MAAATAAKQAFIASSFLSPISNFGPTCSGMSSLLLLLFVCFFPFLSRLLDACRCVFCLVAVLLSHPLSPIHVIHFKKFGEDGMRNRLWYWTKNIWHRCDGWFVSSAIWMSLCALRQICLHDAGRTNRSVRSWRHKSSLSQCLSFGKHYLDFFANRNYHSAAYKPLWRVCCDASTSTGLVLQSFCRFVSWRNIRDPAFAPRLFFDPSPVGFAVAPATEDALSQSSVRDVLGALSTIIDPDFGTDIVSCGFVKDLSIDNDSSQVQKTCAHFCNLFFCTVSPLQ